MQIKPVAPEELPIACEIINDAATAYRGVIPDDRWKEPYMPLPELQAEFARGVTFYGAYTEEGLSGVMGIEDVKDVTLIRHAYVRSPRRGQGIGRALLHRLYEMTDRPVLIGTWRAAAWAISFYRRNGFELVSEEEKDVLLGTYWSVPPRQVEESVVLVDQRWAQRPRPTTPSSSALP